MNDTAEYYERKSPGLGVRFLDEIERCPDSIQKFPEAATLVRERTRRRNLQKFPYALLYSISAQEIRILAVMNQKRRPMYWHDRR
jgi:toxin ParE1/3/4